MIDNKLFNDYRLESQENFLDFLTYIKNINESKSTFGNLITSTNYYYKILDNTNWMIFVSQSGIDLIYYKFNQINKKIKTWEELESKFKQILNNYTKESYVNILNSYVDELKSKLIQENTETKNEDQQLFINDIDDTDDDDFLLFTDYYILEEENSKENQLINMSSYGIKNFILDKSLYLLSNPKVVFQKSFINELINDYNRKNNTLLKKIFKLSPNSENIRWPKINGIRYISILTQPDEFLSLTKYTRKEEDFVINYLKTDSKFNDLLIKFYFAVKNQDPILLYELQYFNLVAKFDIIKKTQDYKLNENRNKNSRL